MTSAIADDANKICNAESNSPQAPSDLQPDKQYQALVVRMLMQLKEPDSEHVNISVETPTFLRPVICDGKVIISAWSHDRYTPTTTGMAVPE
jgi:hypothetical protein